MELPARDLMKSFMSIRGDLAMMFFEKQIQILRIFYLFTIHRRLSPFRLPTASFFIHHSFSMHFCIIPMLHCHEAMFFFHIISHPSKMVSAFELKSTVVSDKMQVLNRTSILRAQLFIVVSQYIIDKKSNLLVTFLNIICNHEMCYSFSSVGKIVPNISNENEHDSWKFLKPLLLCHETVDMPVVLWVVTLENGNQRFGCNLVKQRPYL